MTVHNNIIRQCKWDNCGFTVEQEGDSYGLVFHTALDAAMFCLQVRGMSTARSLNEGMRSCDWCTGS